MSGLLFPSLRGYDRQDLPRDLIAGLTVWAVLIPEALAYASIAGVSPTVGLYAAPAALVAYAAFGSSRHLVIGPMSATAALSAAVVADEVNATGSDFAAMTAAVAIAVGVVGLAAAICRLGFVANFISEPVLKGFIVGLALTIIAGQLPGLLGVDGTSGNFFEKVWGVVEELGSASGWTAAVGLLCLVAILGLRKSAPRAPGSLVAVAMGLAFILVFGLDDHGVEIVGDIDSGLPPPGFPDGIGGSDLLALTPGAIGILLVGFAEGLGAAKNYAARNNYDIDANRELLGLGAANLAAGFSSGMVVNGSLSKTAVNGGAGAKSQVSGLLVAGLTVLTVLFLTGLFEKLPEATLAAIVIAAVVELVDVRALRRLYALRTRNLQGVSWPVGAADFIAAFAAMMGVLVFDTLPGLFIGIAISMLLLLLRVSSPRLVVLGRVPGTRQFADVDGHPENAELPGLRILRPEGSLIFASADHIRAEVRRLASGDDVHSVILDAERVSFVDITAQEMLLTLAENLAAEEKKLALARASMEVRQLVRETDEGKVAVPIYPTLNDAVEALSEDGRKQAPAA